MKQEIVDPTGASPLVTEVAYEARGSGRFMRPTRRRLPAHAGGTDAATQTNYDYSAGGGAPCAGTAGLAGMVRLVTGVDPDGTGPEIPQSTEYAYDAAGSVVGTRRNWQADANGAALWSCTTYDKRGRVASISVPAYGGEPARTVTYAYAVVDVGNRNPFLTSATEAVQGQTSLTITTKMDLLGRIERYTDGWGNVTNYTYDAAGRLESTSGPGGNRQTEYDKGLVKTQKLDLAVLATATYDPASGELASVAYGKGTSLASIDPTCHLEDAGRRYPATRHPDPCQRVSECRASLRLLNPARCQYHRRRRERV